MAGAPDRTRTGTDISPRDFKSLVATYYTTGAYLQGSFIFIGLEPIKKFFAEIFIIQMRIAV